ncbi:hypothetical protein VUR80DRAFT_6225 [Thermomyces stellatus]
MKASTLQPNGSYDTDSEDSNEYSTSGSEEESSEEDSKDEDIQRHLKYLEQDTRHEVALSPVFTPEVRRYARELQEANGKDHKPLFPQHALIRCKSGTEPYVKDNRLYYNVAASCSMFICGSQGSGKSHNTVVRARCMSHSIGHQRTAAAAHWTCIPLRHLYFLEAGGVGRLQSQGLCSGSLRADQPRGHQDSSAAFRPLAHHELACIRSAVTHDGGSVGDT